MHNLLIVYGLRRNETYRQGDNVSFDKRLRRQDPASDRSRATRVSTLNALTADFQKLVRLTPQPGSHHVEPLMRHDHAQVLSMNSNRNLL